MYRNKNKTLTHKNTKKMETLNSMKQDLQALDAMRDDLQKKITRAELEIKMNEIESAKMENWRTMAHIKETLGDTPEVRGVIKGFETVNAKLDREWRKVYDEFFYL